MTLLRIVLLAIPVLALIVTALTAPSGSRYRGGGGSPAAPKRRAEPKVPEGYTRWELCVAEQIDPVAVAVLPDGEEPPWAV